MKLIFNLLLFDSSLNHGILPDWSRIGFSGSRKRIMFRLVIITGTTKMVLTIDGLHQPIPEQLADAEVTQPVEFTDESL